MNSKVNKTDEEWRAELTAEQFVVCRQKGTERPFSGELVHCKDVGVYRCACCGADLFDSATKYESGTGWPSFWQPISTESVVTETDLSRGMRRVEALCGSCGAHLGHVFEDGPEPTGQRYCMNSVALDLNRKSNDSV